MSVLFQPWPGPQTTFAQWDGYYGLYAGAAGPGKTELLRWDPWDQIESETARVSRGEIQFSVGRSILFRRTMPELRELIDRCHRDFGSIDPGATWNQNDKTWTMSCGYKYMFGQMEEPGDWIKYYGFEFSWIGFDELTTFTEEQFDQLDTRLRCKDPVLHRQRRIRAGTNPVGIGLEWVRRRFVEIAPPGTPVVVRVPVLLTLQDGTKKQVIEERSQLFIPAKLSDNPSIDQASYTANLMVKSSATRRQLLDGDWYVSAGSCFGELWDQELHVCKPFKIPPGWTKFRSGDYGYSWPGLSSIQWWAVDTDGNFVCYRSLTIGSLNAAELAIKIREIEMDAGEWDVRSDCSKLSGPLDSSCWNKTGHVGLSIAQTMIQMGVIWTEAPRSETTRQQAADQIRQRLTRRSGPHGDVPGIRWFDTCWNWARRPGGTKVRVGPIVTIPILAADDTKPDVWDTKGNDHDTDSCGYACMFRPLVPTSDTITQDEQDDLARARRKAKAQQSTGKSGYWKGMRWKPRPNQNRQTRSSRTPKRRQTSSSRLRRSTSWWRATPRRRSI